jgi:hypothetical protein
VFLMDFGCLNEEVSVEISEALGSTQRCEINLTENSEGVQKRLDLLPTFGAMPKVLSIIFNSHLPTFMNPFISKIKRDCLL